MNAAHLHLLMNHVPVLGAVFSVALLVWAMLRRSEELLRTALLAWALVALSAIPVYFAGTRAEDIVQDMPGVNPASISAHEDAAEIALAAICACGAWAAAGLWFFRRSPSAPRWFLVVLLLLGLAACTALARTADLGGRIRHPEAVPGWVAPSTPPGGQR